MVGWSWLPWGKAAKPSNDGRDSEMKVNDESMEDLTAFREPESAEGTDPCCTNPVFQIQCELTCDTDDEGECGEDGNEKTTYGDYDETSFYLGSGENGNTVYENTDYQDLSSTKSKPQYSKIVEIPVVVSERCNKMIKRSKKPKRDESYYESDTYSTQYDSSRLESSKYLKQGGRVSEPTISKLPYALDNKSMMAAGRRRSMQATARDRSRSRLREPYSRGDGYNPSDYTTCDRHGRSRRDCDDYSPCAKRPRDDGYKCSKHSKEKRDKCGQYGDSYKYEGSGYDCAERSRRDYDDYSSYARDDGYKCSKHSKCKCDKCGRERNGERPSSNKVGKPTCDYSDSSRRDYDDYSSYARDDGYTYSKYSYGKYDKGGRNGERPSSNKLGKYDKGGRNGERPSSNKVGKPARERSRRDFGDYSEIVKPPPHKAPSKHPHGKYDKVRRNADTLYSKKDIYSGRMNPEPPMEDNPYKHDNYYTCPEKSNTKLEIDDTYFTSPRKPSTKLEVDDTYFTSPRKPSTKLEVDELERDNSMNTAYVGEPSMYNQKTDNSEISNSYKDIKEDIPEDMPQEAPEKQPEEAGQKVTPCGAFCRNPLVQIIKDAYFG